MHYVKTLSVSQLTRPQPQEEEARSISEWQPHRGQAFANEEGLSERQAAAMRLWLSILTIFALVLLCSFFPHA